MHREIGRYDKKERLKRWKLSYTALGTCQFLPFSSFFQMLLAFGEQKAEKEKPSKTHTKIFSFLFPKRGGDGGGGDCCDGGNCGGGDYGGGGCDGGDGGDDGGGFGGSSGGSGGRGVR